MSSPTFGRRLDMTPVEQVAGALSIGAWNWRCGILAELRRAKATALEGDSPDLIAYFTQELFRFEHLSGEAVFDAFMAACDSDPEGTARILERAGGGGT